MWISAPCLTTTYCTSAMAKAGRRKRGREAPGGQVAARGRPEPAQPEPQKAPGVARAKGGVAPNRHDGAKNDGHFERVHVREAERDRHGGKARGGHGARDWPP